jgi:ubiquinone biosynthesis protein Coq4
MDASVDRAQRPLSYQRQDSPQTLGEGLAEYYAANGARVTPPKDLPPESAALFRSHDMCHVIFGLDTSLADETLVDARTLFSCDVGVRRYVAYLSQDAQAKALFRELGWWAATMATFACLPRIARAALQAMAMRRKWPWTPPEEHLARPLADLRREYRIKVI